jgi:SAM-dependent methyltransferase
MIADVERYYRGRFEEYGPTARGVDWNGEDSQEIRFVQLLRVVEGHSGPFSLLDYGCGYGALAAFLLRTESDFVYRGYDVCAPMIDHARRHCDDPRCRFTDEEEDLEPSDYAVASGVFNVKLGQNVAAWTGYVVETISRLADLGRLGFAFNVLTSYSDPDRMRDHLFYADPCFFFDLCKREHSRNVALLHDYGLWEFTILVRHDR